MDAPHEFERDAGERLADMLEGSPIMALLAPAAALVGQQLEFLSPVIMGTGGKRGFYGGKVVQVPPRTLLFVAADGTRLITVHCRISDGAGATDVIRTAISEVEMDFPELGKADTAEGVGYVLNHFLTEFGAAPGEKGPRVKDQDKLTRLIGFLLRAQPPKARSSLAKVVDACLAASVCPAWVSLLGPASSGRPDHYSFGSLLLPVAPYMEDFVEEMEL